jgi:hypothetical protein
VCPEINKLYEIEAIKGLQQDHDKRRILFLVSKRDKRVTAKPVFEKLDEVSKRAFMTRFDAWIGGQPPKDSRYHGWYKSQYSGKYIRCFVFKSNPHRLYGFLCHPKRTDLGYEACILVKYAKKNQQETDELELRHVEEIRNTQDVFIAIDKFMENKLL